MAAGSTGQPPYGLQWDGDRLVAHPGEAATRRRLFELFVETPRKGAVARALNAEGHATRRKSKWTDTAVGRLLVCASAVGRYAVGKTTMDKDGLRVNRPEEEWTWVRCEQIVSDELWKRVQEILGDQSASPPTVARAVVVHPFAGVLYCGCGERMSVPSNSPKYVCTGICGAKIPEEDLEAIFEDELQEFLRGREELLGQFVADPSSSATHAEASRLRAEIGKVESEIAKFVALYTEGKIDAGRFGLLHRPQEDRLERLRSDLAAATHRRADDEPVQKIDPADFVRHWKAFPPKVRKRIIDALVERIVIADGQIDFFYRFGDPIPKDVTSAQQTERPTNGRRGSHGTDVPEYIRLPRPKERCPYSGLSRSKLNELILPNTRNGFKPPVASKSIRQPGRTRGVRLILWESLDIYLSSHSA
ncbi:hypothetical protein BH23VER1_BH23VER1_07300 [soil metagenome]